MFEVPMMTKVYYPIQNGYHFLWDIEGFPLYDMIYLTAIRLTPGGSSTVHIYTQIMHRTTQSTQTIHRTKHFTH